MFILLTMKFFFYLMRKIKNIKLFKLGWKMKAKMNHICFMAIVDIIMVMGILFCVRLCLRGVIVIVRYCKVNVIVK